MTETANRATEKTAPSTKGVDGGDRLTIEQVFSTPGVHPYDELT